MFPGAEVSPGAVLAVQTKGCLGTLRGLAVMAQAQPGLSVMAHPRLRFPEQKQ